MSPIRFPGGDIGELAVNGTLNDLAMMGARPVAISLAYVIEEGLPLEELRLVTASAAAAAASGRGPHRHRRHQGRRPRRRGPAVREHVGDRARARRRRAVGGPGARPATR